MKDENKEKRGREWANSIFKVWTIFKAPTIWGRIWADVIRGSVAELFSRVCPRFALPARADRKCLASDQKILAVARSNQIRIWKKKYLLLDLRWWQSWVTIMRGDEEVFWSPNLLFKIKSVKTKTTFTKKCNNRVSPPVWPEENRQMSIKVAQKWFH